MRLVEFLAIVAVLPEYPGSFDCIDAARCATSTTLRMTNV